MLLPLANNLNRSSFQRQTIRGNSDPMYLNGYIHQVKHFKFNNYAYTFHSKYQNQVWFYNSIINGLTDLHCVLFLKYRHNLVEKSLYLNQIGCRTELVIVIDCTTMLCCINKSLITWIVIYFIFEIIVTTFLLFIKLNMMVITTTKQRNDGRAGYNHN